MANPATRDVDVRAIERPDPALLKLYVLRSLVAGPFFFVVLPVMLFRYMTLRYRFDDDGVSVKWGVLFRREIDLAYDRIQDLHLTAGLLERWMGVASVSVQTASGNAGAEMVLEGLRDADAVRDFLYAKMRGPRSDAAAPAQAAQGDEAAALLRQMADDLAAVRRQLAPEAPR